MEKQTLLIKADGNTLEEKYADAIKKLKDRGIDVLVVDNGIKNTETAPKYDPCRPFRKGDIVRVVEWHGRSFFDGGCHPNCNNWTVSEDENSGVTVNQDGHTIEDVPPCYLELVTPVEELEPYYYVAKNDGVHPTFLVRNRNEEHRVAAICECWNEEDAQRICDMYNAEYRKEQK